MPSDLPAPHMHYEHRPKPFSQALMLDLGPQALEAERGRSKQVFSLKGLEQIRLSYSPANTARLGFKCQLRASDGKTLTFSNLTWKSMVETGRQDEDYAPFIRELVARAARANPQVVLLKGTAPWRYRLFMGGVLVLAPALLLASGLFIHRGAWPVGVLTMAVAAWLAFYAREYLVRNRPGTFPAGAIPPEVMPPA